MAEFWSNLLYIPAPLSKAFPHRLQFDDMIREHALGRFDEMLASLPLVLRHAQLIGRVETDNLVE